MKYGPRPGFISFPPPLFFLTPFTNAIQAHGRVALHFFNHHGDTLIKLAFHRSIAAACLLAAGAVTIANNRTRSFAIGPAIKYQNAKGWFITAKWQAETDVRNTAQGSAFWIKAAIPF
jgi:hypothetical protein